MARLPASFDEVFQEHVAYVWRVLRYLGVPEADREDACQDVFLVVHRKIADFEGQSSVRTWLYGICTRVAAGRRRKAYVAREVLTEAPPEAAVSESQATALDARRARELLLEILSTLDDAKRTVFVLHEIEEHPMAEVATLLGCPLRTAYSRLEAAREEVSRAWKRALLHRGER